jgi:hypothetical protein
MECRKSGNFAHVPWLIMDMRNCVDETFCMVNGHMLFGGFFKVNFRK